MVNLLKFSNHTLNYASKCIRIVIYLQMNSGETSPPSLLTEADLIALMDKHGIGILYKIIMVFDKTSWIFSKICGECLIELPSEGKYNENPQLYVSEMIEINIVYGHGPIL